MLICNLFAKKTRPLGFPPSKMLTYFYDGGRAILTRILTIGFSHHYQLSPLSFLGVLGVIFYFLSHFR